jgi:hypothetical protein
VNEPRGVKDDKGTAIVAATDGADVIEVGLAAEVLLGAKTHGAESVAAKGGVRLRRKRKNRDRGVAATERRGGSAGEAGGRGA